MDLRSQSCSSGHPSCLAKTFFNVFFLTLDMTRKVFKPNSFILDMLIPLLSDLDLGWGLQDQRKTKFAGFIFLHTFQLKGMKFGMVVKPFTLTILRLLLSEIY